MSEREESGRTATAPGRSLAKAAGAIEAFVKPIYTWLGYGSALVLIALVTAMVYSIFARRLFHAPLQGSDDIIRMSMLVLTFLAIGLEHLGHEKMTVDVLADHLPSRVQAALRPFIYLLGIAILCMAVWQLVRWGIKVQDRGETTRGTLKLPKYPFAYLAAFGMLTLIPIYLSRFLGALDGLRGPTCADKGTKQ